MAACLGPSLVEEAARDLRALEAVVSPVLDSGDYTVCDHGPAPGGGVPGPCLPRAPTAAERDSHRAAFMAEMARRRDALALAEVWTALLGTIAPAL